MLSGLSFSSAFVFSINSLIFFGFPLTSCHLAEASIVPRAILKKIKNLFFCVGVKVELKPHYLLFRGFISLCVQLSKNITKCFLFIIIHFFSTHFAINLFYLSKLWNSNFTLHVNERNQNKNKVTSHSDWPRVLLFHLAHKQCNGIIKGSFPA